MNLSKNYFLSFDAKYKTEDTASYLLHKYNRQALKDSAVNAEQFCERLGLNLYCEYVFKDGYKQALGFFAPDKQVFNTLNLTKLALQNNSIVIEKSILDDKNFKLYNYAIVNLISHYLLQQPPISEDDNKSVQISFLPDFMPSINNVTISLQTITRNSMIGDVSGIDGFAEALIMPKNHFKIEVNKLFAEFKLNRNSCFTSLQIDYITQKLSDIFNVPKEFAYSRLKGLNYV